MDPESVAFQPRDDFWRIQNEMLRVQQTQSELTDRLNRLERRHEDDSRLKNVWGTASPFPSVLGGTPQQVPLQQPTAEHFSSFDDAPTNLIGNLQLDADDEPRRIGTTSRANSVRFDETADYGRWAHASRTSLDLIPRTGSGMGGHAMSERSYSHKSIGGQSSTGHSVHSATSGRANSLTGYGSGSAIEPPGLAPGLFILGSVPAIIRCWLTTVFKHDTMLYAAVCSGSYASYLDIRLIEQLGLQDEVTQSDDGTHRIKMPIYFPEAIPVSSSSHSSSPAPQLPSLTVTFTVVENPDLEDSKSIQIFLGSDMMRAHNADILFSSNQLTLYDDDQSKMRIPLVRPEDERTFNSLYVGSGSRMTAFRQAHGGATEQSESGLLKPTATEDDADSRNEVERSVGNFSKLNGASAHDSEDGSSGRPSLEQRPGVGLGLSRSVSASKEPQEPSQANTTPRSVPSPAIWSNWRRDTERSSSVDVANGSSSTYQRRDTGIKVLKKPGSRIASTSISQNSPVAGQSRFFDDGKRRESNVSETDSNAPSLKSAVSGDKVKESGPSLSKGPSSNPGTGVAPRSSPLPLPPQPSSTTSITTTTTSLRASVSPPRYLPPHMHDEVLDATSESTHTLSREPTAASSPSEAYAHLTLDAEPMVAEADRTRSSDHKPHIRASSPAKRLHSDMDDSPMDIDGQSSTRRNSATKSASTPQRSLRATSVEMVDATSNGSSESASLSNVESTATSVSTTPSSDLPSLEDQVNKVLALSRKPLKDGQVGYIVSHSWLERVWARTPQYADKQREFSKSATEGAIGPVDNSNLVDPAALSQDLADQQGDDFVSLRPNLTLEQDFEVLPEEAWNHIVAWYGVKEGTPIIKRYAHDTPPDEFTSNIQYELNPPIFTIRKVRKTVPSTHQPSKKLVASRSDNFVEFMKAAKRAANIDVDHKVRIWRILNTPTATDEPTQQPSGILTPEASPPRALPPTPANPPLVIDAVSLAGLEIGTQREEVTGKDEKANEIFNDDLNLSGAGLAEDQVLVLEEQDENGTYITDTVPKASAKSNALESKAITKGTKSATNSGRSTPAPSGPLTRGRTRNGRTRGTAGLTNLGNTCYMNSALQCVRSVEELAVYFLSGKYKREINTDNPLGHNGNIAKAYAGLMAAIYDENGTSSFAPKNFKNTLGRAQPIFSGYGQQDSQEFLSFLVDGLHEDLNRIHKKPYTENPESDDNTHRDPEAIKALGEKFRAIHRARNDSVAMDLFNGFYKNTMVCPDCDKVSITFDPFSLVTLQLPVEQTWQHTVRWVPWRGRMWDVQVDIDKHASIKALKEYVGKRFGVESNRIMASEVYSHKYYKHFEDSALVSEIQQRDEIYLYELDGVPTNWPPPKSKKKKSYMNYTSTLYGNDSHEDIPEAANAAHDNILVPILHRAPNSSSAYRTSSWNMKLWPSFILVSRDEAKDYDSIFKKVLSKVGQMTSRDIFTEINDHSLTQSRSGSDVVVTTEEDASPNGDARVQDGSIDGEDNMVEVTMTDPAETPQNATSDQDDLPEVLRPGTFIPPDFHQLFSMNHSRAANEFIPTGWSSVDTTKHFEPISKRVRVVSSRGSSMHSLDDASNSVSSDEDDAPQFSADPQASIEAATQSSDEDENIMQPSIETNNSSRNGRQKPKNKKLSKHEKKLLRNKNRKTYSKKGKGNVAQPTKSYEEPEDEDDERLIKMGEAIVLDWTAEAFEALFEGVNTDDARGMETTKFIELLEDEELKAKKARRIARRKNGITLEECFAETSKSEVLSEDNAWYCSRCKELRRATKTLEIWTAPDILVVHLKRFSSHRAFRDKVDALVDFPMEGLDLTGKVGLPEDKELVYDLFAVDNHYGGLGGGHYTAFAKNFFDQQWYEYNDSSVSKCGRSVVTTAAYLLFYRRRSAGPLGPPALQEIVNKWRDPDMTDGDEENDGASSRNDSPAGNGLRLDGSSRNGSSSAFATGAGALRGGGSAGAGSLVLSGAAAGTPGVDDEELDPPPYDEGFSEPSLDLAAVYAPLHNATQSTWNFASLTDDAPMQGEDGDDAASDQVNAGDDESLEDRMQDFDNDREEFVNADFEAGGGHGGATTPLLTGSGDQDDSDVAEIRV
ncbi:UCH-domain-containing protein [Periconia macrospinosa]|uniref:ubiquitinyl hydrolase 1 n=1 Tax=Periconia macrospinosa TaxID=97972 RepID=A0A2V1E8H0_9PLEO|nr:UCH-domain-containing protein [Periconia macrospinosa]